MQVELLDGVEHMRIPAGQTYKSPGRMYVEGDASAASYWLAGPRLHFSLSVLCFNVRISVSCKFSRWMCSTQVLSWIDTCFVKLCKTLSAIIICISAKFPLHAKTLLLSNLSVCCQTDGALLERVGATLTGGKITVEGCGEISIQGDVRFADVMEQMGAKVEWDVNSITLTGMSPLKTDRVVVLH